MNEAMDKEQRIRELKHWFQFGLDATLDMEAEIKRRKIVEHTLKEIIADLETQVAGHSDHTTIKKIGEQYTVTMNWFCPECNEPASDDAIYCSICGAKFVAEEAVPDSQERKG